MTPDTLGKSKRRGIPGDIERDVEKAISEICEKYRDTYIGKNKDRFYGIVTIATREALGANMRAQ